MLFVDIDEGGFKLEHEGNVGELNDKSYHANNKNGQEKSHVPVIRVGEVGPQESQIVLSNVVDGGKNQRTEDKEDHLKDPVVGLSVYVVDYDHVYRKSHTISYVLGGWVRDPSVAVHWIGRAEGCDQDLEADQSYHNSWDRPCRKSLVWEKASVFGLLVYLGEVLPDSWLQVIIDVLIIKSRIDDLGHCEKAIEDDIKELCEIADSWKTAVNVGVEHHEGNDDVLPTVKNEKVG